jgi:alkanesulfonate monooxygenase SsuD/methylene tetrahydromethanopterin reductase-like flavin-dependent oxidoreductase (luciferase family)
MLEIAGEISQGVLLTWCTPEHARTASKHIATGAARAGVSPETVEVATLVSVAAPGADDGGMRRVAATYAGRFPRYRRLMAEAGFADEVEEVRRAWREGDVSLAESLVPEGLINRMSLPTDPGAKRERLAEYREAGLTLPIIAPRVSGPNAGATAKQIIRANAPA